VVAAGRTAALLAVVAASLALPARHGAAEEIDAGAAPVTVRRDAAEERAIREFDAALEKLPAQPETETVSALVRAVPRRDADRARLLATALGSRGGSACARGLRQLLAYDDTGVRQAALQAIAQNGLRVADSADLVRAARRDDDPAVRDAAYAALAVVGDATDVPSLVETLRGGDPDAVRGAYDALTGISGVHLAYREFLWRHWWKETKATFPARLKAALDVLETGTAPGDREDARTVIRRIAWIDVRQVGDRLSQWLNSGRPELRADAFRLCADLRLGDLADDVRFAQRAEYAESVQPVALECARRLGVAASAPTTTAAPASR
jgi:hypothetical protein